MSAVSLAPLEALRKGCSREEAVDACACLPRYSAKGASDDAKEAISGALVILMDRLPREIEAAYVINEARGVPKPRPVSLKEAQEEWTSVDDDHLLPGSATDPVPAVIASAVFALIECVHLQAEQRRLAIVLLDDLTHDSGEYEVMAAMDSFILSLDEWEARGALKTARRRAIERLRRVEIVERAAALVDVVIREWRDRRNPPPANDSEVNDVA